MHLPLFTTPAKRLETLRGMTRHERLLADERDLRFYTNLGLLIAVGIGVAVVLCHGGAKTAALTAYGAAIGLGGILGFLFGVPSTTKSPITIKADSVAVGAGQGASAVGGNVGTGAVVPHANAPDVTSPPENKPQIPENNLASASQALPSAAPLVSSKPSPAPTAQEPATNTSPSTPPVSNLEQVADWVTKLLLGGGLTQMQRIPPKVWQWSRMVALGILRDDPKASEQLIVAQQAFAAGLLVYGFVLGFFGGFLITKLQLGKAIF